MKKALLFIVILLGILFIVGCSSVSPKVKECTELCFENGGKVSQYLYDQCQSSCSQLEYYGGEAKIDEAIEKFNSKVSFNNEVDSGVYDDELNDCSEVRVDLNYYSEIQSKLRNGQEGEVNKITTQKALEGCKNDLKESGIKDFKDKVIKNKETLEHLKEYKPAFEKCFDVVCEEKRHLSREGSYPKECDDVKVESASQCDSIVQSALGNSDPDYFEDVILPGLIRNKDERVAEYNKYLDSYPCHASFECLDSCPTGYREELLKCNDVGEEGKVCCGKIS